MPAGPATLSATKKMDPIAFFPKLCRVFLVKNQSLIVLSFSFEVLVVIRSVTASE
jgi:hypothetical protein